MPRTARAVEVGTIYHVLNRGNGRMRLFYKPGDYQAFLKVLSGAVERYAVDLLAYCLLPNHWHLVVRPREEVALAKCMGWLGVTHVRRHHLHYQHQAGGHLYQGRYKSFPVQDDGHFLTVCRYVEANAVRAGLAKSAADWSFSSYAQRMQRIATPVLVAWPVDRPSNWTQLVNGGLPEGDLSRIRESVKRGQPWGSEEWVRAATDRLGLGFTFRKAGRPKKSD